ncbi:MAG TPA: AAA family ATPase [Polyangiaceae bacterium]|nr:AAA family ATPase [Polyangiaceae bacterium]
MTETTLVGDVVDGDGREVAERVQAAVRQVSRGLVEREVLVELIVLSAVAEEHVLVIGEPGTAKSEAVRRVATTLGGRYFEYLLGRFTEPSELFGPLDLLKLQQGKLESVTAGMLPEAEIAFLDEVFLGSTAILNTLLGILNERQFRRGNTVLRVPLRLCVGASNSLPSDPALAAFGDRFLTRVFVSSVPDTELEELLRAGLRPPPTGATASLDDLTRLVAARRAVDLSAVQPAYANAIRLLRRAGIALSDRRLVRAQNLIAAAAALSGRRVATGSDLWPLIYAVPTQAEQESARDTLRELLAESESSLSAAALDASSGPRARAARLAEAATTLLEQISESADPESWKLRAEGILREVDASFPASARPEPLPALRERLIGRLGTAPRAP